LPAGVRRVPVGEFVALTTAGCAIWACGFVTIGFAAGNAWTAIDSVAGKALLAIGICLLVLTFGKRQKA
jgi:membrane protein DedA with SNARE-associated domain